MTQKSGRALLLLGLILLTKENAALAVFGVGIFAVACAPASLRIWGVAVMAVSVFYFFAAIYGIIPAIGGQPYAYLAGNYLAWGQEGLWAFWEHLSRGETLVYLIKIFGPLSFLSFWSGPILISVLPSLIQNVISRNPATVSIYFHYTIFLTPFVFVSAIYGAAPLSAKRWGIFIFLFFAASFSGVSDWYVLSRYHETARMEISEVRDAGRHIPAGVSLRTHEFLAPHFAHRRNLHIYENQNPGEGASLDALQAEYVLLSRGLLGPNAEDVGMHLLREGYAWGRPPDSQANFFVLRRKT